MTLIKVKFKKLHPNAVIPKFMTTGAACADLVATEVFYDDEDKVTVKFGFSTEIPEGYKMCIAPRSSFNHKNWIQANSPGQVDSDFRGEWLAKYQAIPVGVNQKMSGATLAYDEFPYKVGERVAQCWIEPVQQVVWEESDQLTHTLRGEGAFGSTGNK